MWLTEANNVPAEVQCRELRQLQSTRPWLLGGTDRSDKTWPANASCGVPAPIPVESAAGYVLSEGQQLQQAPPPMPAGCVSADAHGPVSFKWTGGFVFPQLPHHGFVTTDSAASCCAKCQSFKNCTFWTFEHSGTVAKPTCYDQAGACCYLRTAAAWAARTVGDEALVSGSTKPLPVAPPPPPGVKVVACVGDSITAGYLSSNNMDYPHQLQTMLGSKYKVINFGAGGRTMLKKGDQPYWTTGPLRFALESKPDIVVLMLGTNDAKVNNWRPLHAEFPVDYKTMIDTFKNLTNVPKIYLMVPPPLYQDGAYGMNQTVINSLFPGDGVAGVNTLAKASGLDAPIDLFSLWEGHCPVLGGTPGHPANKTHVLCDWIAKGDACHPSNEGYGKLAAAVKAKIAP